MDSTSLDLEFGSFCYSKSEMSSSWSMRNLLLADSDPISYSHSHEPYRKLDNANTPTSTAAAAARSSRANQIPISADDLHHDGETIRLASAELLHDHSSRRPLQHYSTGSYYFSPCESGSSSKHSPPSPTKIIIAADMAQYGDFLQHNIGVGVEKQKSKSMIFLCESVAEPDPVSASGTCASCAADETTSCFSQSRNRSGTQAVGALKRRLGLHIKQLLVCHCQNGLL